MIHSNSHTYIAEAVDTAAKRAAFMHWFGMPLLQGELLILLYANAGQFLTAEHLANLCCATPSNIGVRIHKLRSAMNTEAVDFVKGQGYRLTEVGVEEAKEAMEAMARSLVA